MAGPMNIGLNFGGSLEPLAAMGVSLGPGTDVGEPDPGHPPYAGAGHEPAGAFDFYWDEGDGVYRMRDPVVVTPDGEELECDFPGQLDFGKKYYCVVGADGDGNYEAKVVPENEVDGSGYGSWWKVPLFTVPHERREDNDGDAEAGRQYHVGAVVVGGGGGGDTVTPDDVSTDLRDNDDTTDDGKLQIKDWDHSTPPDATTTMAEDLVASQSADKTVARQSDKALKYKASGRFYAESDTNIVFTPDNAGGIKIGVYYI